MSELTVASRDVGGGGLLYPKGFINGHTGRLFEGALQKAISLKQFKIVVNCSGLSYIASAGLGAMMGAIDEIRSNGGDLRMASLNETVQNILDIPGSTTLYHTHRPRARTTSTYPPA